MSSGADSIGASLRRDMIELANHLRQERLFVNAEQENLQRLNEKVLHVSSDLAQEAWITARQRGNLNNLIIARPECTPGNCCRKANVIENSRFVDGYKQLRYRTCLAYGEFLSALRKSPQLVASCLVEAERTNPDEIQDVVQCLAAGLYGSCLLADDKILVLKLLRHLMYLQVIPSDNPRRLLRHGTCAFSRFYSVFHENLFSAKLFLTAALHEPITQLLMDDETYLDIDPDKASVRFSPTERAKKFGKEGTAEYQTKLQCYRLWTVNTLFRMAQRFIVGIRDNVHCFPTSVRWLVKQMAEFLTKNDHVDAKEVHGIITDLVFTYFICPAIVNPEPYGITDAPVSQVARFNLMQVGQILQMLSLIKYQPVDPKTIDLYKKFDRDSVSSLLDSMLEGDLMDLEEETNLLEPNYFDGLDRSTALFTENELNSLVAFLRDIDSNLSNFDNPKLLNDLLAQLPPTDTFNARPKGGDGDGIDEPNAAGICPLEDESAGDKDETQDVLVIPFSPGIGESVGTLSEQKILRLGLENELENELETSSPNARIETQEKRTRFSLSHEEVPLEGSIGGNASDNLEAVSEAASNHSVASSLELEAEDQNDNLSDMVSANVSGRGSPNISGRDTPSSQLTEGDDGRGVGELRQLDLPPPNIPGKQSRSEIDDKFYKFEIKKLIEGDETVSMVSDTWSTDVLASDSETVEQHDRQLPTTCYPLILSVQTVPLDTSETASEAWSTDVLASDSERLTEVDTDDTASVARSDDTTRSEIEEDLRRAPPIYHNHHPPEFVDKNANSISNHSKSLEDPINEIVIGLSTTSLASSSSSGSDSRSKNPDVVKTTGVTTSTTATSTGTIPKSISFDMTAERGDKELLDDDQKNKRGFFGKLKMSLKNRRGKAIRCNEELNRYYEREEDVGRPRLRRILSEDVTSSSHAGSIEEILAKYRRKTSMNSDSIPIESNHTKSKELEDERLFIDPNNVETCFAFSDAKRKLRMVLSEADLQQIPRSERGGATQRENDLVAFLQLQLAEAINLQDRGSMAHLHETLRCVRLFNEDGCVKLVDSLRKDYQKRSAYVAYLIRCRQGLLTTLAHLNRLRVRIRGDRDAVNNHLVSVCVRVFLEKKDNLLGSFSEEFKTLRLADEKQELVDNFLRKIYTEMDKDPIWQCASKRQLELAETVVERIVMARVYHYALYPNSDGDIYRDQLLHDHIKKLAKLVGPNHKDLRIRKMYHYECPWPWAQAELAVVSAYKTPRDKLRCVFRCATTIMSLLSMASERNVPAADDLVPVLVYVIIKTNPPSLLSTVQYVDSFYGNRLEGEEQYWWTQFCSAIEFIKTMD